MKADKQVTPLLRLISVNTREWTLVLLLSVWGFSCTTAHPKREALSEYHWEVQTLRMEIGTSSTGAQALRDLGVIYLRTGHFEEAQDVLSRALVYERLDPKIWFYQGLAQELIDSTKAALTTYERYPYLSESSVYSRAMQGRIAWLKDARTRLEMAASLAQDSIPSSEGLSPKIYAVLPLACASAGDEFSVLGTGLSELLSRDLGQVRGIEIVEPRRVRMALDVVSGPPGRTDVAPHVQVGRLLGAGKIIEGTCRVSRDGRIVVELVHRDLIEEQVISVSGEGRLEDVASLEKKLFDGLLEQLGIFLLNPDRTIQASLEALMAYSQGLTHEEAGQLERAAAFYRRAVAHAPRFVLAAIRQEAVEDKMLAQGADREELLALVYQLESYAATPYLLEARLLNMAGSIGSSYVPGQDNRKLPPGNVGELPAPPRPVDNQ